ncbi:hypothetical protein ACIA5A_06075 [Micromonospora sp. NPDC051300]|uniref:hypothetical protein n=1 Tax=Micromonospora sp. NPDC051300 TaxID=3364286 RepID=UPI0037AF58D4
MSALSDQLDAATSKLGEVRDDVKVLLDAATVPAEDAQAQAAADRLTAFVDNFRAETPDADGSDTPTE